MARESGDFPTGLWIGIGAFFLVFSCVPLGTEFGELVFFWDLFDFAGNARFGAVAVYVLVAGVALIVLANLFRGVVRGLLAFALGGTGVLLSAIAVAGGFEGLPGLHRLDLAGYGSAAVPVTVAAGTLLFALVGNNVRIHYRDSRLARMLGGTGACVAGALLLVAFIIEAVQLHGMLGERFAEPAPPDAPVLSYMLSTYPVPQLVCEIPLILSCVFMGLNLSEGPKAGRRARKAQWLGFAGLGLLGAWIVLGPTITSAIDGENIEALWGFLRRIRMVGIPYCFALMVGGGLAEAVRGVIARSEARSYFRM